MDFNGRIDALLQESQQGLSAGRAQPDPSQAAYNPGSSRSMAGMTQSYASASQRGQILNQWSNQHGVNPNGQTIPSQSFRYQPYSPRTIVTSEGYSNNPTIPSHGSSLARYGISVSGKGQSSNDAMENFDQDDIPTLDPSTSTAAAAAAGKDDFNPQSSTSKRRRRRAPPALRKGLLPTPGPVDSPRQEHGEHLASGSLFRPNQGEMSRPGPNSGPPAVGYPPSTSQHGPSRDSFQTSFEAGSSDHGAAADLKKEGNRALPAVKRALLPTPGHIPTWQGVEQAGANLFRANHPDQGEQDRGGLGNSQLQSQFGASSNYCGSSMPGPSRSPVPDYGQFKGSIAQRLYDAANRRTNLTSQFQDSSHASRRVESVSSDDKSFGGNPADEIDRNLPVPDGTRNIRYPPPDVKNLLFDSVTGYRFDPTTGLHYDANSGFYLNHRLKLLLRWDPMTSTYMVVSNNPAGLAPPAVSLLETAPSPKRAVAGLSSEELKALARELAPLLKSGEPEQPVEYESRRRDVEYESRRRDIDNFEHESWQRRHDGTHFYPGDSKRYPDRSSERRPSQEPEYRARREGDTSRYYSRASPDDAASDDERSFQMVRFMSDDRPVPRDYPAPRRGWETPPALRKRWQSVHTLTVHEIHEDNLRDGRNLYGRCFPVYPPSAIVLAAPLPSHEEMRKPILIQCLQRILSSDAPDCRSIRVFQGDFGAPCNYALIRFSDEEEAVHWYKLQRGIVKFKTPRRDYVSYMFFAEDNWFCFKSRPEDKCCEVPTPNFPFRSLCYKCYEPRSKLDMPPIVRDPFPTPWIGILQLDCIKFARIDDVMDVLPPHQGINIESMEFLREPSGLPIGVCVLHIQNIEESKRFFDILTKADFSVSYIRVNKQALDFPRVASVRRVQGQNQGPSRPSNAYPKAGPSSVGKPLSSTSRSASGKRIRRKRKHPTMDRENVNIFADRLGKDFMVVDECGGDDEKPMEDNPEPFLRPKPLRQLLADQLKNVLTLHMKHSKDPDNLLRTLLPDPPAVRGVIMLAPVPSGDRDSVKEDIIKILTADKVDFSSVMVFQGKGSGAPCHYSLIIFHKPCDALSWYNKRTGIVHLNSGFKSFMFFSPENWVCPDCRFPSNFPFRSWCNRCFKSKVGEINPLAVTEAATPSRFLGISSLGLPIDTLENGLTKENILEAVADDLKNRVLSCEMILVENELPGLCMLEAQDDKDSSILRNHLVSKGWRPFFLQINKEEQQNEEEALPSINDSDPSSAPKNLPSTEDSEHGTAPKNLISTEDSRAPNYSPSDGDIALKEMPLPAKLPPDNSIKYDPMKHLFNNSVPSRFILLSPSPSITEAILKKHLETLFAGEGIGDCSSYLIGRPDKVGSPHDYIQVTFTDLDKAQSWYDKHNGHLELIVPGMFPNQEVRFDMQMFYSESPNWYCRGCYSGNFPLRSFCYTCYIHRYEECYTPATISNVPTRWIGLTHLRKTIYHVGQVKKLLPPLDSFNVSRMVLVKEPNPLLHVGLCVIETPSAVLAQELVEFVKKYDKKLRLIYVNFEPPPGESDSVQTNSELTVSPSVVFSSDRLSDNIDKQTLWWQGLEQGVEEGGDMLKKLFQDQNLMPNPAPRSIFVRFPLTPVQSRQYYATLLEESGVDTEVVEASKFFHGKNVGGPSSYFILDFTDPEDAKAWRAMHDGKWVITFDNGKTWTSHLHPTAHNWICKKCDIPNFPLRLYCFWCFEPRDGGSPIVTISETPTKFVGISRFQNWCASENILLENVKTFADMKSTGQLKKVHHPCEPSGIPLGLCILEFEDIADAQWIFIQLIALTQKRHVVMYLEGSSFSS